LRRLLALRLARHSLSVKAFSYETVDVKQSEFQLEKR